MIIGDIVIDVNGETSKANGNIILYRGDYNIEVTFTINQSFFRYRSSKDNNLIEKTTASYAQMLVVLPDGQKAIITDMAETKEGKVTLTILKEYIDEFTEIGDYSYQIRLYDENKEARFTIPPVEKGLKIKEPITHEAEVGGDPDGVIPPFIENLEVFDDDGNYNKTEWKTNDLLSPEKLNKIEGAIDAINKRELEEKANSDEHQAEQDGRLTELENRADENDIHNEGQDIRLTDLESRATNIEGRATDLETRATNLETRATNLETDSARKEVLIQALLNEETDKVVTVEAHGNEKHLDYAVDDWLVKINKIEGQTLVNVCDQKDPIPITKSYTVNGTNHVPLQGEYDGKAKPVVHGNTLVNRANGVQDITVLPKMELQGNNKHDIDGADGAKVEVTNIKGNTMVNLVCADANGRGICDFSGEPYENLQLSRTSKFKLNTVYTLVIRANFLDGHDVRYNKFQIGGGNEFDGTMMGHPSCTITYNDYMHSNAIEYDMSKSSQTVIAKVIFSNFNGYEYLKMRPFRCNSTDTLNGRCHASYEVMIFEGDLTRTPELIPNEYVEGLESSFEYEYASLDDMNIYDYSQIKCNYHGSMDGDYCVYNYTGSNDNVFYTEYYCKNINIIKPSTEYTVVVDIIDTTLDQDSVLYVISNESNADNDPDTMVNTLMKIENIKKGRYIYKCQSLSDITQSTCVLRTLVYNPNMTQNHCRFKITLLEGDQTSIANKHQAEVKTVGKNKFDGEYLATIYSDRFNLVNGQLSYYENNTTQLIDLCPKYDYLENTQYTLNGTVISGHGWFSFYYTDGTSENIRLRTNTPITSSEGKTVQRISASFSDDTLTTIENLQIEEGTEATEYEPYKEDTHVVYLNTPLLEGDELVYKDGQLYHYHKMNEVVLDGTNNIGTWGNTAEYAAYYLSDTKQDSIAYSDSIPFLPGNKPGFSFVGGVGIAIRYDSVGVSDYYELMTYLQNNPTTVVYELAKPWYEPLGAYGKIVLDGSEEWLLYNNGISSGSPTAVFYSRVIHGMAAIGTNVYSNRFIGRNGTWDVNSKAEGIQIDEDIALTIQINKSKLSTPDIASFKQWLQENPTTVIYKLANPNTIKEPITIDVFNNSTLAINSNVPVESTVTNYSHRLQGFSEPYTLNYKADGEVIHEIVEDRLTLYGDKVKVNDVILVDGENTPTDGYFKGIQSAFEDGLLPSNLLKTTSDEVTEGTRILYSFKKEVVQDVTVWNNCDKPIYVDLGDINTGDYNTSFTVNPGKVAYRKLTTSQKLRCINAHRNEGWEGTSEEAEQLKNNIIILEGDWTHLSEEDFNHSGQYKVEYKVTGKNKSPKTWKRGALDNDIPDHSNWNCAYNTTYIKVEPNTKYIYSNINNDELETMKTMFLDENKTYIDVSWSPSPTTPSNCKYVRLGIVRKPSAGSTDDEFISYINENIQFEKGSTATSYEPYKEQIKTFYLNSPLLEGDKIEEINGVATHVHRMGKVVLDGSENWKINTSWTSSSYRRFHLVFQTSGNHTLFKSDRLKTVVFDGNIDNQFTECVACYDTGLEIIIQKNNILTLDDFKQWLQNNPTTVVYELAKPWNEPLGAYGKIVLDGSEEGWLLGASGTSERIELHNGNILPKTSGNKDTTSDYFCDKLPIRQEVQTNEYLVLMPLSKGLSVVLPSTKVTDLAQGKQWLKENPLTIIYKLAEPEYQGSTLCDSYTNGHLDLNGAVPVEKVEFISMNGSTKYLSPSADYILQFNADSDGYLDVAWIGGAGLIKNKTVTKGLNRFTTRTYSSISSNYFSLRGIGFNASNIQVVQADENIEFDYFEGLQSSFESCPKDILDRSNITENHCLTWGSGESFAYNKYYHTDYIPVQSGEKYSSSARCSVYLYDENKRFICYADKNIGWKTGNEGGERVTEWVIPTDKTNVRYMRVEGSLNDSPIEDFKLFSYKTYRVEYKVEGTQATPYEPYKEYTKTFYLNSPLLQGDTIEEVNGKMCHVHRMGKVVLDGSEDEGWSLNNDSRVNHISFYTQNILDAKGYDCYVISDMLPYVSQIGDNEGIKFNGSSNIFYISLLKNKLNGNINEFKQWLQNNPTTVVYELAEPYVEPIEPEQEQLLISSVKEGDLSTETSVPINNMSISYTTCVPSAIRIESELLQTQTIQNEQDALLVDLAVQQAMMNLMM